MISSPEERKPKSVLWTSAMIAAGSLAIIAAKKQPGEQDQKIPAETPQTLVLDPATEESPHLTHTAGSNTEPRAVEAAYITSYNQARKPRKRHIIGGLGGVANTGFSRAEVRKAQARGHSSASFKTHPFYVTTYGPPWSGMQGTGITATGLSLKGPDYYHGKKRHVVAVDPDVIPLGSLVTVWPNAEHYRGAYLAADTGGAINGNHVDVYDWTGKAGVHNFSARGAKVRYYRGIPAGGR